MKTYNFIIEFKRPSYRSINWISQLMFLFSIAAFLFVLFQGTSAVKISVIISIIGIIGWWAYCIWQEKKGSTPYYRIGILIAAIGWYSVENGKWIGLIYLIAALLEKQAKFPQEVAFDDEEIVFNTFPKKRFAWKELNNVIIKDGIISIDFKNNKLIQKEIQSGSSAQDEKDFNEFCLHRLQAKD